MTQSLPVHYSLRPVSPAAHLFEVSLTVTHPAKNGQVFFCRRGFPAVI